MRKYKKIKLLILDEWLLYPLKESEARDLLELVEARCKVASTIFCSQFDVPGWHESLFDPTLADAICDRIIYNSHTVTIKGESMDSTLPYDHLKFLFFMASAPFPPWRMMPFHKSKGKSIENYCQQFYHVCISCSEYPGENRLPKVWET